MEAGKLIRHMGLISLGPNMLSVESHYNSLCVGVAVTFSWITFISIH